ncbi:MAG: nucleoside deaminase [Silvibacterium sp.]
MRQVVPYCPVSQQPNPEFLKRAIQLATENVLSGGGGPFAALVVKDGAIISEAVNTVFTTNDPTAHGEVNAIRKACAALDVFSLRGCEIYTSSEPCPMCLAAIYWAHLDAIYFGNSCEDASRAGFDDIFLYKQLALDRDARSIPSQQLLQEQAAESFRLWEQSPNKMAY